jgi:hypothetical protein
VLCIALLASLRLIGACGQTVEVGIDDALSSAGTASGAGSGNGGAAGNSGEGAAGSIQGGAAACVVTECRGNPYHCGNCVDDDQDGKIDSLDPDCLGPCDNDESALTTGLTTMQSSACRQDCYFDGDNGPGNDKCQWSHSCDPVSLPPDYPPSGEERCAYDPSGMTMGVDCASYEATQSQECKDACLPVVPNGCDCFGCCEIPGASGEFHYIGLAQGAESCTLDRIEDTQACPPCTPVKSCQNECEECEVCVGRERPVGCEPDSGCPAGQAACTSSEGCDYQEYCVTGCCVRAPEPT